ncbi:hypothetical protein Ddye_021086 [Dipteronia dyeriana]|uniref:ABC-type xenobiotic transporter n=1 Tax=Dipteronia dyeriana TaxID=168575 RepID=A0AAD9U1S8_9ROSI|nr:hypothetical protein Ddye_021086 [Dipteronia dyeriana]
MRDGMIVQSGKYEELLNSGIYFGALVAAHKTSIELAGMNNKATSDEKRETGRFSLDVYKQYYTQAFGWWAVASAILTSLLWQACLMASYFWLAYETSEACSFIPSLFIIVYAIIAVVSTIFVVIKSFLIAFLYLITAQSFFNQLLSSILHVPMSFFDTTPSRRVLTRVSTDQANVDVYVPMFLSMVIVMYFTFLSIVFITCLYAWPVVFLVIPLVWINIWYRGYYLASYLKITRIDSITKAPVIHHFLETISCVMTIRSFRRQDRFFKENNNKTNANLRMDFHNNALTECLGFRLELIGSVALCIAILLMILLPSSIIKQDIFLWHSLLITGTNLSLSYGLSLNGVLFWAVYRENRMVSIERVKQFTKIPSEPAWKITNSLPSSDWPIHGDIELKNLRVRYMLNTPIVLKGITFKILGGEKIGVVGRTGSGKSTLV